RLSRSASARSVSDRRLPNPKPYPVASAGEIPALGLSCRTRHHLGWLSCPSPDLEAVRLALAEIVTDGHRAAEVIGRIRDLIRKAPPRNDRLEINEAIGEVVALTRGETVKNGISVQTQLADGLPLIQGDRVQLQQVMLNLIINAVEAMSGTSEGPRELLISTGRTDSDGVVVAVRDSGPGLAPATLERLFESFYTTKPSGLGLGHRSAVRSSKLTADDCGRARTCPAGLGQDREKADLI